MISHHKHAAAIYKQRVATVYTEVKMCNYDKRTAGLGVGQGDDRERKGLSLKQHHVTLNH